jgi:hypothetical protein
LGMMFHDRVLYIAFWTEAGRYYELEFSNIDNS